MKKKNHNNKKYIVSCIIILLCVAYTVFLNDLNNEEKYSNFTKNTQNEIITSNNSINNENDISDNDSNNQNITYLDINNIPEFDGEHYSISINNNIPYFTEEDLTTKAFEKYTRLNENNPLDKRCGVAYANICREIMPADDEERTGQKSNPTGWKQNEYINDEGKRAYLYNRCHLIAWSLAAENDNELNLITGTVKFNSEMKKKELEVKNYIDKHPNNHVLYRVTPIFEGENLVASGVEMEAYSVEDNGKGVKFNIYCYNVQEKFTIDYATRGEYL